jgi:glutamine amidotransferase
MITIIDYGIGNLGSIHNMLKKVGFDSVVSRNPETVKQASALILPGVGAFDTGMQHLRASGLLDPLNDLVMGKGVPVLGICLGAQLMTLSSDEGSEPGLGWFQAHTRRMDFSGIDGRWPLPNIGWRDVHPQNGCQFLDDFEETPRFYFVHSYYLKPDNASEVSMTARYGFDFACGLSRDNIHCVQFHPEKSHKFGMNFFRRFFARYA